MPTYLFYCLLFFVLMSIDAWQGRLESLHLTSSIGWFLFKNSASEFIKPFSFGLSSSFLLGPNLALARFQKTLVAQDQFGLLPIRWLYIEQWMPSHHALFVKSNVKEYNKFYFIFIIKIGSSNFPFVKRVNVRNIFWLKWQMVGTT